MKARIRSPIPAQVCVAGTRTWRLAHPDHGPSVERAPGAVSAAADDADGVRFLDVALAPGDALLVPPSWWHRVVSADDPARGFSAAMAWYVDVAGAPA